MKLKSVSHFAITSFVLVFCWLHAYKSLAAAIIDCRAKDAELVFRLSGILAHKVGSIHQAKVSMSFPKLKTEHSTSADEFYDVASVIVGDQLVLVLDVEELIGLNGKLEFRLLEIGTNNEGGKNWSGSYRLTSSTLKVIRGHATCFDSY